MSESVMDNYVKVPRDLYRSGISPRALMVWICLRDNAEGFNPGITLIEERTHLNRKTVLSALVELTELGLVSIAKSAGRRNQYTIKTSVKSTPDQCKKYTGTSVKSTPVPVPKVHHNKNKNKNETTIRDKNNPKRSVSSAKLSPKPKKTKPVKKAQPKYEQQDLDFAKEWIEWLSDRGSHHAKSAKKASYATALGKLRRKYGLTNGKLPEMRKLVLENEFWANNMISPNGLLKTWSNGQIACLALLDTLDKVHKKKAPALTPSQIETERKAKEINDKMYSDACKRMQEEDMQNVTPIRPLMIGS